MTESPTTTPENFEKAIDYAISFAMDCGLHPAEMVEALKRKAEELVRCQQ